MAALVSIVLAVPPPRAGATNDLKEPRTSETARAVFPQNPLWPRPHIYDEDCASLVGGDDADFVAWCQTFHGTVEGNKDKISMIEQILADCDWSEWPEGSFPPERQAWAIHSFDVDLTYRTGSVDDFGASDATEGKVQEQCHYNDWVLARYGPFVTVGNYTWDQWGLNMQTLGNGTEFNYVNGYYVGSVTEDMKIVSYPPLHQHHSHLHCDLTEENSHEGIVHGDEACLDELGGVACNIRLFPEGNSFRMKRPIVVNGETNDVRIVGSPELVSYQVAMVRLATREQASRPVTVAGQGGFMPYVLRRPGYGQTEGTFFGEGYFHTKVVPGDTRTAVWDQQVVTTPFRLRFGYLHLHWQWTEGMYVYLNVTAKQLGLPELMGERWAIQGLDEPDGHKSVDKVLNHLDSLPYTPMCAIRRDNSPRDVYEGYQEAGDQFYRLSSPCRPMTAAKGMPMTLIAVSSPQSEVVKKENATNHFNLRGIIETDAWTYHKESARAGGRFGAPEFIWWPYALGGAPDDPHDDDLYDDSIPRSLYSPTYLNGTKREDPVGPTATPFDPSA